MIIRHKALLATTALATVLSSVALAEGPGGEIIAAGEASVSRPDDHSTVVNQRSAKAIIDWRDFSISADHNVEFVQPDMESVILNRVYGGEPSKIYGGMSANGTVMLVNPLTYGVSALRTVLSDETASGGALTGDPSVGLSVLFMLGFGAVTLIAGTLLVRSKKSHA